MIFKMLGRQSRKADPSAGTEPDSISGATPFTWHTRYGIFHFVQAGGPWDERRQRHVIGHKLYGELTQNLVISKSAPKG